MKSLPLACLVPTDRRRSADQDRCTVDPNAKLPRFSPRTRAPKPIATILDAIAEGQAMSVPEIELASGTAKRRWRRRKTEPSKTVCQGCGQYIGSGLAGHARACGDLQVKATADALYSKGSENAHTNKRTSEPRGMEME